MKELFEEKMKTVLGLIRPNNTGEEAQKITQAAYNLAQAHNTYMLNEPEVTETKQPKK